MMSRGPSRPSGPSGHASPSRHSFRERTDIREIIYDYSFYKKTLINHVTKIKDHLIVSTSTVTGTRIIEFILNNTTTLKNDFTLSMDNYVTSLVMFKNLFRKIQFEYTIKPVPTRSGSPHNKISERIMPKSSYDNVNVYDKQNKFSSFTNYAAFLAADKKIQNFYTTIIDSLLLPVYSRNGLNDGENYFDTTSLAPRGTLPPLSIYTKTSMEIVTEMLSEHYNYPGITLVDNVYVLKSGTGTGKSVAITTFLIDNASIFYGAKIVRRNKCTLSCQTKIDSSGKPVFTSMRKCFEDQYKYLPGVDKQFIRTNFAINKNTHDPTETSKDYWDDKSRYDGRQLNHMFTEDFIKANRNPAFEINEPIPSTDLANDGIVNIDQNARNNKLIHEEDTITKEDTITFDTNFYDFAQSTNANINTSRIKLPDYTILSGYKPTSGGYPVVKYDIRSYQIVSVKKIAVLQPRHINVTENADYIGKLYNCSHKNGETYKSTGGFIGYKYRGNDLSTHPDQVLTIYTQESFLQTLISKHKESKIPGKENELIDYVRDNFRAIILDEAHELTVVNEILFYFFKILHQHTRDTTCFIILSATINPEKYIKYFYEHPMPGPRPAIQLIMKTNTITISANTGKYTYAFGGDSNTSAIVNPATLLKNPITDIIYACVEIVQSIIETPPLPREEFQDDILIFVPSRNIMRNINNALTMMIKEKSTGTVPGTGIGTVNYFDNIGIYEIYSQQSDESETIIKLKLNEESDRKQIPQSIAGKQVKQRIFIGTNKAETGITIGSLKYIIDTGFKNTKFYDPNYDIETLITTTISKNNALQRYGRVGRKPGSHGYVYQLYTKETFNSMQEDDYSGMMIEKFEKYYPTLMYLGDGKIPDLLTKNISWKTLMHNDILYSRYRGTPAENIFLGMELSFWQTNCLVHGIKNGCAYEMLIMIAASILEIETTEYMIAWCKKIYPSLTFLGTLIPKIMFIKYILTIYPGIPELRLITIGRSAGQVRETPQTNVIPYDADADCIINPNECSVAYDTSSHNLFHNLMYEIGVTETRDIQIFSKDIRGIMLDLLEKCTKLNIPVVSTCSWENIQTTLISGLHYNEGESLLSAEIPVPTLFKLTENPQFIGVLSQNIKDLFVHELSYIKKIKYADSEFSNGNYIIKDFITI